MMFSIKDFFSKCDQIHKKLQIWSHLLKKSLMENFIFCVMKILPLYGKTHVRENPYPRIIYEVLQYLLNVKLCDMIW